MRGSLERAALRSSIWQQEPCTAPSGATELVQVRIRGTTALIARKLEIKTLPRPPKSPPAVPLKSTVPQPSFGATRVSEQWAPLRESVKSPWRVTLPMTGPDMYR